MSFFMLYEGLYGVVGLIAWELVGCEIIDIEPIVVP